MMKEGGVGRKGEWGTRERQLEGVEDSCLHPRFPKVYGLARANFKSFEATAASRPTKVLSLLLPVRQFCSGENNPFPLHHLPPPCPVAPIFSVLALPLTLSTLPPKVA